MPLREALNPTEGGIGRGCHPLSRGALGDKHPRTFARAPVVNFRCLIEERRLDEMLHRKRLDSDPSGMQPMFENNVKYKARRHCDGIIQPPGWRCGNRPLRAPAVGDAVCNRPREESTE